jgi:dipeptidyl-peptidase 4
MKQILSLTFISIFLALNLTTHAQNGSKTFSLNDLMKKGIFRPSGIHEIRSMADGLRYTTLSDDYTYLTLYSYSTGDSIRKIIDIKESKSEGLTRIFDYEFSDDETSILIQSDYEPIYRRSFKADYYIYNIKEGSFKRLSTNGKQQLATFSPDGNKVAFVRDNNLVCYRDSIRRRKSSHYGR